MSVTRLKRKNRKDKAIAARRRQALKIQGFKPVAKSVDIEKIKELDGIIQFILQANEPTVLDQGGFERIAELSGMNYRDEMGTTLPYLTHDEASCLQIRRGSLTETAISLGVDEIVVALTERRAGSMPLRLPDPPRRPGRCSVRRARCASVVVG